MRRLLLSFLFLSAFLSLKAQQVRPEFQVRADAFFLNSEFDASGNKLATSQTLGAVRATPYVGLRFGKSHRLMAGFSALQHFGTPGKGPRLEAALWYQYDKRTFTLAAGIFPRAMLKGAYSTAVVSDEIRLQDAHLEGFLLQWHPGQSHYEIALDWNGKYGVGRREQFNVITSGYSPVTSWLALGWEGMFHHLACSAEAIDVVDDHILHPYVKADAAPFTVLEELSLQAGLLAGMQRDRGASASGTSAITATARLRCTGRRTIRESPSAPSCTCAPPSGKSAPKAPPPATWTAQTFSGRKSWGNMFRWPCSSAFISAREDTWAASSFSTLP